MNEEISFRVVGSLDEGRREEMVRELGRQWLRLPSVVRNEPALLA